MSGDGFCRSQNCERVGRVHVKFHSVECWDISTHPADHFTSLEPQNPWINDLSSSYDESIDGLWGS